MMRCGIGSFPILWWFSSSSFWSCCVVLVIDHRLLLNLRKVWLLLNAREVHDEHLVIQPAVLSLLARLVRIWKKLMLWWFGDRARFQHAAQTVVTSWYVNHERFSLSPNIRLWTCQVRPASSHHHSKDDPMTLNHERPLKKTQNDPKCTRVSIISDPSVPGQHYLWLKCTRSALSLIDDQCVQCTLCISQININNPRVFHIDVGLGWVGLGWVGLWINDA